MIEHQDENNNLLFIAKIIIVRYYSNILFPKEI